jgi:hypothetical protein
MLSKCDHCQHEFQVDGFPIEDMPDGVEKTYFECPHCKREYVAFYTDPEIRELQAKIRNTGWNDEEANTLLKMVEDNKRLMNELRKRMEMQGE